MGDMAITVPCAKCRKATMKMLSELEVTNQVACPTPGCGGVEDLTTNVWRQALRDARKAADEFDATKGK